MVWESFSCEAGGVLVDANWARLHRVILLEESLPDREHTHTHTQAPRRRGTVALKALRKVPERRTQDDPRLAAKYQRIESHHRNPEGFKLSIVIFTVELAEYLAPKKTP